MNYRQARGAEYHAGSCIPHDHLHLVAHIGGITMHRTLPAGGFVFTERAAVEAAEGVIEYGTAGRTKNVRVATVTTTVHVYHEGQCLFLAFDIFMRHAAGCRTVQK